MKSRIKIKMKQTRTSHLLLQPDDSKITVRRQMLNLVLGNTKATVAFRGVENFN